MHRARPEAGGVEITVPGRIRRLVGSINHVVGLAGWLGLSKSSAGWRLESAAAVVTLR